MSDDTILGLASKGDRDALACLRDALVEEAANGESAYSPADMWAQAEILARMSAEHGRPFDQAVLSTILLVRSLEAKREGRKGAASLYDEQAYAFMWAVVSSGDTEAISYLVALIERCADDGDPSATAMLEAVVSKLTPQQAANIKNRVAEESCQ